MRKTLLVALAVVGLPYALQAQVSVNTTGAAPDASAMLDVSSTTQGLLPPRMTQAQRTAIALPATGLVVYQTDGTAGLYCNHGTPASPQWRQLVAQALPAYGHYVNNSTNQTLTANGSYVNVILPTALESSGLVHSAGTSTVTVATPGLYRVSYGMTLLAGSFGGIATLLQKNGTLVGRISSVSAPQTQSYLAVSDEGLYTLGAGDVITLKVALFGGTAQVQGATLLLLQVR